MKTSRVIPVFILALFLLSTGVVLAGQPQISVTRGLMEIASVKAGKEAEVRYTFSNLGDAPLVISDVKTTCGCTVAELSAKTIPPGGDGYVRVVFHAEKRRELTQKYIYLYTNDPNRPKVQLTLQAQVDTDVDWSPNSLTANWPVRNGVVGTVTIQSYSMKDLTFSPPTTQSGLVQPVLEKKGARTYVLTVKVPADANFARQDVVLLKNSSDDFPLIKIPVYFRMPSKLTVSPSRNVFWTQVGQRPVVRHIVISRKDGQPVHIRSVTPSLPCFKVRILQNDNVKGLLEVSLVSEGMGAGPCDAYLHIVTDVQEMNLNLPCNIRPADEKKGS